MAITTCIFDAYGTLFDVSAAARQAAAEKGREDLAACWQKLANEWRLKQLQYTWLRAIADQHTDFWQVTQDGLDWALQANALHTPELRDRLLQLYWELSAYSEVPDMLKALKEKGLNSGPAGGCGVSDVLKRLEQTIHARAAADPSESHTAKMLAKGPQKCAEKFGEEAIEAIIAAATDDRENLIYESADVLYHMILMLHARGIEIDAVLTELERREGVSGIAEKAARPV